jgi:hypothetical protein
LGGRESAEVVRKRQLLWREQNPEAWRRLRAGQKVRYYRQFQTNIRHKGKRWTPVEGARITAEDYPGDRKLSKSIRPVGASHSAAAVVPLEEPKTTTNGAELFSPLSKTFDTFNVMCCMN